MAREFKETAHLKTDKQAFSDGYDAIDWGALKEKPLPKKTKSKHSTAGLCGEYGMSTFDDEKYKENFENIDWGKKNE